LEITISPEMPPLNIGYLALVCVSRGQEDEHGPYLAVVDKEQ